MLTNVLVDYTQVLWSKPEEQEWDSIGDSEHPFRITLPTKVAGPSTAHFQDYRIWWRIEACMFSIISMLQTELKVVPRIGIMHMPVAGVGTRLMKHYDLPFIRYDLPPHPVTPSSPPLPLARRILCPFPYHYSLLIPQFPSEAQV
jgi:hypothetical protein